MDESEWLGRVAALVPKRHARRSVTRNLLKRQIRAAVQRLEGPLGPGLWLVRLRAGFETVHFPSAASQALRLAARDELDVLLAACRERMLAGRAETRERTAGTARPESPGPRNPRAATGRTGGARRR